MEEALKYIRKAREVTHDCCSKVIEGQSALDHFFLVMEDKTDTKTSDKEKEEIELERGKMKGKMKSLQEAVQKFENTWLRGEQKITETEQKRIETEQLRTEKGRRDHLDKNDSGFISVDSSILPQNSETSSIIAQATKDPDEKQPSEKFHMSISGPAVLPSIPVITEETEGHMTDTTCSFSEIAPSDAAASAISIIEDVKHYTKHPLEHEEPNSILDRDKEACNDINDKLNLDKCDKLDPDSMLHERGAKENEKGDNSETDLSDTHIDDLAQADLRTHVADTEQEPKVEVVRESTAFANSLGEDGTFLQEQGNHQKLRHKCSKNKSNSL